MPAAKSQAHVMTVMPVILMAQVIVPTPVKMNVTVLRIKWTVRMFVMEMQ